MKYFAFILALLFSLTSVQSGTFQETTEYPSDSETVLVAFSHQRKIKCQPPSFPQSFPNWTIPLDDVLVIAPTTSLPLFIKNRILLI
jgi:hypothetical protein